VTICHGLKLSAPNGKNGGEILPTVSAKLEPLYGDGFSDRNLALMVKTMWARFKPRPHTFN